MITLTFGGSDSRLIQSWQDRVGRVAPAVVRALNTLHAQLQSYIVSEKLSGQVLQHRSGKLAGSIRVALAETSGDSVRGGVQGAGGVAPYGRYHEYGTASQYEIVPKQAKVLAFSIGGQTVFARRVQHPPIAERSFMRTGLQDMRQQIVEGLRQQITATLTSE